MALEIVPMDATTTRLVLHGRLDALGCERVGTAFTAAASRAAGDVLIDLTRLEYIGSLGIRLLISNARMLQRHGRRMVIFGARPQPRDVFETVALGDLVPIAEDQTEAMGLLAEG